MAHSEAVCVSWSRRAPRTPLLSLSTFLGHSHRKFSDCLGSCGERGPTQLSSLYEGQQGHVTRSHKRGTPNRGHGGNFPEGHHSDPPRPFPKILQLLTLVIIPFLSLQKENQLPHFLHSYRTVISVGAVNTICPVAAVSLSPARCSACGCDRRANICGACAGKNEGRTERPPLLNDVLRATHGF